MINGATGKQIYLGAMILLGLIIIAFTVLSALHDGIPQELYFLMITILSFVSGTQVNPASPNTHTVITKDIPNGETTVVTSSSNSVGSVGAVSGTSGKA